MENENLLKDKYRKNIQYIIDKNKKFYGFANDVKWDYYSKDNINEFAYNKNQKIYINIVAVHRAVETNNTMYIEYFIIHEIRHIYQKFCVNIYDTDISKCSNIEQVKMWKENYSNYKSYDNKEEYYSQIVEFDAFVFATAVMNYIYRDKNYVQVPETYTNNDDFWFAVDFLIKQFLIINL